MTDAELGYLALAETTEDVQRLFDSDIADRGFVMNVSRLWAHQPAAKQRLMDLMGEVARGGGLTEQQRAVLIAACASTLGDSYCSLAWGKKLAGAAGDDIAASVIKGDDEGASEQDRALARWARQITRDPNSTSPSDVTALRDVGFDDAQIFAVTAFVGLRLAFSTINDALGVQPDRALAETVPRAVRDVVTYGRPVGTA